MTKLLLTPVTSGKTIDVKVRARNMAGNYSTFNTTQQIIVPASTSLPSTPTSLSASSDPLAITLFWTNPSNKDLKSVEIYYSTSSGGTKNLIGSIDAVRSANQEYNLVYDSVTFSQNQTYYFTVRAVNTSAVASSYTSEVTAAFNTVNTNNVTQNAISNMFSSVQSGNAIISTVRDTINYNSTGNQLQGIMITTVTLGAIPSDIAGFSIVANAMCQKKSNWSPNKYVTAVVLQEVAGNNYWEQATGFGSSAQFLGDQEPDNRDFDDGVQATYSTSSIDTSGDVIGTTGSKYGLFLYTNSEPSYSLGVFAGTGLSITELKR
jgi:hypothetical protein